MAKCLPAENPTANGCCSVLLVDNEECHFAQEWFAMDLYRCSSSSDKVIFHFADRWFLGLEGIPTGAFKYASMIAWIRK
jgi:hypothetical protein